MMKKQLTYQAIEDNGGGLTLVVKENDKVIYLATGFEYFIGNLRDTIESIKNGDNPINEGWEGNSEHLQDDYDSFSSNQYGWEVIADNEGVYPQKMGYAGRKEFEIE